MKISEIKNTRQVEKEFAGDMYPLMQWGDYYYAVVSSRIKWTGSEQRLAVIDVTAAVKSGAAALFTEYGQVYDNPFLPYLTTEIAVKTHSCGDVLQYYHQGEFLDNIYLDHGTDGNAVSDSDAIKMFITNAEAVGELLTGLSVCVSGTAIDEARYFPLVEFNANKTEIVAGGYVNFADLPVQLVPASPKYRQRVVAEQMDELEASVNAGGAIGL